jgi:signal peptidase I
LAELESEQTLGLELEPASEEDTTFPPSPVEQGTDTDGEGGEENEQEDSETPPQAQTGRTGFKTLLFDVLETLLLTIVIYAALSTFIGRYKVLSVSMEPTLHEGQYLLISKQTQKIWPLKRGDVVVFQYPRNLKKNYIKRVIGLPGEKVKFRNNKLYINDELVPEPWLSRQTQGTSGEWQLGEDEYFVMGDNRSNSSDSRAWGPVNSRLIIGKSLLCYWPVECWGLIQHGPTPTPTPAPVTPLVSPLTSPLPAGTAP